MRVLLCLFAILVASDSHAKLPKWNQKMQQLRDTLEELLPEVTIDKDVDKAKLEKNVKKLTELVHLLGVRPGGESLLPPDADPSIPLIKDLFERETKRAYTALKAGQIGYAKNILRNTTGYCISCHTRTDSGPDFPYLTLTPRTEKLSSFEKAELLSATRQFGPAFEEFTKVVDDAKVAKNEQVRWQRSVLQALTIAIRVKRDPEEASEISEKVMKSPTAPEFFKHYTKGWNASIGKWKKEGSRKITSKDGLLAEATRLFAEGQSLQEYPADHSGDVSFLRATAAAHDYQQKSPEGESGAKGLYLEGLSYEILNGSIMAPLSELYYESCVRKAPHSETAGQCFRHYEEAVYFGYSGSGGTFIPEDVSALLKELKDLSNSI